MIDLDSLQNFIQSTFTKDQLYIERFKHDILIDDIDCLSENRKLTIRASFDKIEFSTINKEPEIDFSLFDFALTDQTKAEKLLEQIKRTKKFVDKKNYIDLTVEQKKLADFMSDLSERCYDSGWQQNLEYVLWDTLTKGERRYGQDKIFQTDIEELERLSTDCNCWIYFDDIKEETSIDVALWTQKFNQIVSQNPDILKE